MPRSDASPLSSWGATTGGEWGDQTTYDPLAWQLWTPGDISSLRLHLDAHDLALADGAQVMAWNDRTANAYHFTSATNANKWPIYRAERINGEPAVEFFYTGAETNANAQGLYATHAGLLAMFNQKADAWTVAYLATLMPEALNDTTGWQTRWSLTNYPASATRYIEQVSYYYSTGWSGYYINAQTNGAYGYNAWERQNDYSNVPVAVNVPHFSLVSWDGSSTTRLDVNNSAVTLHQSSFPTGLQTSWSPTRFFVGSYLWQGLYGYAPCISYGAFWVFNAALSSTERENLYTYARNRWHF